MKKAQKKSKENNFQEAEAGYGHHEFSSGSDKISFASFDDDRNETSRYDASLSPEERLHNLYELICISYGLTTEEQRNPKLDNRIIIEDPDEHFS